MSNADRRREAGQGRALRVPYRSCRDTSAVTRILAEFDPSVAIIDIEPLVAVWNTRRPALDAGIADFLDSFAERPGRLRHIVFATNSARRPSGLPRVPGLEVHYVSHAGKPFRLGPYRPFRDMGGPIAVVGDQIATDGLLAWRLGAVFVHYIPDDHDAPVGPRLMRALGLPLRQVLFRPS